MTRLPNDCFGDMADMISVQEARLQIKQKAVMITEAETVPLAKASGRILSEDIISSVNVPPAGNSAVDGYAFAWSESKRTDGILKSVGRSAAGAPFTETVGPGECIKVFTGALLPDGLDTVAMIEDVREEDGTIHVPISLKQGANFRRAGEDVKMGDLLLRKGIRLRPQELGKLASVGLQDIPVQKQLKVGLFSTGDELVNPGDETRFGAVYDSNRYMLKALLETYGCEIKDLGILEDKLIPVRTALENASSECDLVITSGGVSMGDEDHVKAAVEQIGSLHFWRIAIKPGRPLALGQVGNTAFVGLPGNPVAALVCAMQFVRPLIAGLTGEADYISATPVLGESQFDMTKKPGRREWLRGRYSLSDTGQPVIEKYATDGSGILTSLTWANGLIELDEAQTDIKKGDSIRFLPFTELFA